ncbi:NAD(P)/FAD-dependent oxidoreductase [Maribacter chungangensis]|uniref:NAD(P)/FAD-dependent oxidoreductase n=1 Tax=Maribacter chungangensis TaxID=1069117 RepID=A0ABW3B8U7_9FLAO
MNLSYWEYKTWLSNIDFTVVGSGIVGLNCALQLRKRFPEAKILILERGLLPQGASTKNAGFACFGSISEILSDLKTHSEEEVQQLVQDRWDGINGLRDMLGDAALDLQLLGGHELFLEEDNALFHECVSQLHRVNELLRPVFGANAFEVSPNRFNYKGIAPNYISHTFEGQIDTGKMMQGLLQKATSEGIKILNGVTVISVNDSADGVAITTDAFTFFSKKLCVAVNGFASDLIQEKVQPARAQVIITKPIPNLPIKGTFHLQEGYYYFRNIDNRILLGGGRNLDFNAEETTEFGTTKLVQDKLAEILNVVILPDTPFEIDYAWSGIMGVGKQKKPIVKLVSNNVACGVRLGGMGIAIGTSVGIQLADMFQ